MKLNLTFYIGEIYELYLMVKEHSSTANVEDITQKGFIKAYERLHTLKPWEDFHSWLYSINPSVRRAGWSMQFL